MSEQAKRKVGIIACSCEELAEGTVTRFATRRVLDELRPGQTVTLCLPLFLAGGEGDRMFARTQPTIAVDGCELRCAALGTERYSAKPAASIVVTELLAGKGSGPLGTARRLSPTGREAVATTADAIAAEVDRLLDSREAQDAAWTAASGPATQSSLPSCSCGDTPVVTKLSIEGTAVDLVALPLVFGQLARAGKAADAAALPELVELVKIYNFVPAGAEASYGKALLAEYERYLVSRREARP